MRKYAIVAAVLAALTGWSLVIVPSLARDYWSVNAVITDASGDARTLQLTQEGLVVVFGSKAECEAVAAGDAKAALDDVRATAEREGSKVKISCEPFAH